MAKTAKRAEESAAAAEEEEEEEADSLVARSKFESLCEF